MPNNRNESIQSLTRRYQRRVGIGLFLRHLADWQAATLLFFGSVVLVVKLAFPTLWPNILWFGLVLLPAGGIAWYLSRRSRFTDRESVALLDKRLDAGGLLMTLSEMDDAQWSRHLADLDHVRRHCLPKLWPRRLAKRLAPPLVFAIATCLIPPRKAQTTPLIPGHVGQEVSEQLDEMLDLLEEAAVVDEEEQEELREQIEQLSQDAEQAPLTHEKWETVDALRERMSLRLDTGSLQLAKAQAAVDALATGDDPGLIQSAERRGELEKDIQEALQALAKNGGLSRASGDLASRLGQSLKNGEFRLPSDPKARQQMLNDLKDFLKNESGRLNELRAKSCPGVCKKCGEFHSGGT